MFSPQTKWAYKHNRLDVWESIFCNLYLYFLLSSKKKPQLNVNKYFGNVVKQRKIVSNIIFDYANNSIKNGQIDVVLIISIL